QGIMQSLQTYSWPGNIRELENLIKRYVILGSTDVISSEISRVPRSNGHAADHSEMDFDIPASGSIFLKEVTKQAVRKIERNIILKMLEANHWNRKKAAKALNISYRAMLYKLKETGLQSDNDNRFTDEAPAI